MRHRSVENRSPFKSSLLLTTAKIDGGEEYGVSGCQPDERAAIGSQLELASGRRRAGPYRHARRAQQDRPQSKFDLSGNPGQWLPTTCSHDWPAPAVCQA